VRRNTAHPIGRAGYYSFGTYSPILKGTWDAAYWSAQCALSAAHDVASGAQTAYALCRPPGHHAATDLYGGFCYLNNAAIAARSLGERVAILDIDFHHGNGTQEIFYMDPAVLYCSLHADPDQEYPYFWGAANEIGEGAGKGYNCNYPLPLGCDDELYLQTLDQALRRIQEFQPRYLVVSLGLDIIQGDEVGGFRVTPAGLGEIGQRIAALRHEEAPLPTVIIQEGGYLLSELGELVVRFLRVFE
jgi:acetoin utilization deacetylase AcuC-like enzyme